MSWWDDILNALGGNGSNDQSEAETQRLANANSGTSDIDPVTTEPEYDPDYQSAAETKRLLGYESGDLKASWVDDMYDNASTNGFDASKFMKGLTTTFTDMSPNQLASLGGGLYGLYKSSQGNGTLSGAGKTGYQGSIPKMVATRTQLPYTEDTTRRPGSAGRRYFTDNVFSPAPTPPATATATTDTAATNTATQTAATGGLMGLASGGQAKPEARYLRGGTDGMADEIKTSIDGHQPARLSHGEFVIPADVVGHLGNGNSEAGANKLYEMMSRIRKARTGNPEQGKRINPNKFLPS